MITSQHNCHPLIIFQPGRGYQVHPAAIQFLNTLPEDDQYAVLSVVGKSKTGKSFLLNNLLGDPAMFPINNHIGNSSHGIMISTKMLQINGIKVFVLDSEGFGSLDGNDDRDCKFFILNLLLSSVILYNSLGTIDEQTINNFSMIIEVGKLFEKQLQTQNSLPALFWVLRDFSLKMQDKNGSPITPKQYLESALDEQKGNSQAICHKNRIRRVIKSLFYERTCETLVLPTEENPAEMNSLECRLRDEFIDDLKRFKNKLSLLIQRKGCKYLGGKKMSIPTFVSALHIYTKCLNRSMMDGTMPKIENITFQLRQSQAKGCKDKFFTFLNEKKKDIISEMSQLLKSKEKIEDLEHIKNKFLQPVQKFYETTRNNVYQLTGSVQLEELSEIKSNFYEELQKQFSQLLKKWQNANEDEDIQNICVFLSHIADEAELDKQYAQEIKKVRSASLIKDKTLFANILMKLEITYLRRKLQLSKEINLQWEKLNLELEFTKKELRALQIRNKQLESQMITQIKDSRKSFLTPNKQQLNFERPIKSGIKQVTIANETSPNQKPYCYSTSKIESSSFYVPYVSIQKQEYLLVKIARTLIKQDNKRNNYIEYVIDVNLLGQKWTVNRKFKDFSELHSILVMMFQTTNLPDCKVISGPLTAADFNGNKKQIVEQRRRQLEMYIHDLIEIEGIRNSRIMQKFLKINKEYTTL